LATIGTMLHKITTRTEKSGEKTEKELPGLIESNQQEKKAEIFIDLWL